MEKIRLSRASENQHRACLLENLSGFFPGECHIRNLKKLGQQCQRKQECHLKIENSHFSKLLRSSFILLFFSGVTKKE